MTCCGCCSAVRLAKGHGVQLGLDCVRTVTSCCWKILYTAGLTLNSLKACTQNVFCCSRSRCSDHSFSLVFRQFSSVNYDHLVPAVADGCFPADRIMGRCDRSARSGSHRRGGKQVETTHLVSVGGWFGMGQHRLPQNFDRDWWWEARRFGGGGIDCSIVLHRKRENMSQGTFSRNSFMFYGLTNASSNMAMRNRISS